MKGLILINIMIMAYLAKDYSRTGQDYFGK